MGKAIPINYVLLQVQIQQPSGPVTLAKSGSVAIAVNAKPGAKESAITGELTVDKLHNYYYYIRGLNQSLVAAKTLRKTKLKESI